ncbi:unnamed protein product [Hermetia illucens]|uniref:Lipase domain-containing protein n=2 Tax=Hermetia illucens TaxID=343691 RepID=A0A7R8YPC5_HERIL|nr:unnamed protein product [Hermetia illucens]
MIPDKKGALIPMSADEVSAQANLARLTDFNVYFNLFTNLNPTISQQLVDGNISSIRNSNFNAQFPTRIICNGWFSGNDTDMNKVLRNAYLAVGNFNVIVLDWSEGSKDLNYIQAAAHTRTAGSKLASFIQYLAANAKLDVNNTYLIGHSLGAHIVGFAGKLIQTPKINTIFGLDPAGIPFNTAGPNDRLNIGDGSYVETINTDIGILGPNMPIGNASFFPNYGTLQPGCIGVTTLCSHARAYVYFGESIEASVDFYAAQCSAFNNIIFRDCNKTGPVAYMGGERSNYDRGVSGIYYLPINFKPPYALGTF